jgi:hypothetical protein
MVPEVPEGRATDRQRAAMALDGHRIGPNSVFVQIAPRVEARPQPRRLLGSVGVHSLA